MVVHECPTRSAIDIFVKISVVYCINIEHIKIMDQMTGIY